MSLIVCLLALRSLYAGDYAADFLNIGIDARALGMGSAFCANAEEATAYYWNPAGLAFVEDIQIAGLYGPHFGTLGDPLANFHHLGFAIKLEGDAVFAVNWVRLKVDDIPVYGELQGSNYWDRLHHLHLRPTGEAEGYIADTEDAFFFSFAKKNAFIWDMGWQFQKVPVAFPFGVNVKWIRQTLGDYEASGFGVDLGLGMHISLEDLFGSPHLGKLKLGFNFRNLTYSKLTWNTENQARDVVDPNLRWGVSYAYDIKLIRGGIVIAYDREKQIENESFFGTEIRTFNRLFLRIGSNTGKPSYGMGITFWKIRFDYAFLIHDLDNLHRLSFNLTL